MIHARSFYWRMAPGRHKAIIASCKQNVPLQGAWSYGVDEGITKLAVLLELTVRSLNNLLERFHHSTTFYVLLSPDWHIPFQAHIVPPLLLAIVLVLQVSLDLLLKRTLFIVLLEDLVFFGA